VREALEIHAVALAIEHQTAGGLDALEKRIEQHKEYTLPYYDRKETGPRCRGSPPDCPALAKQVLVRQLKHIFEHIYLRYQVERMHPKRLSITFEEHHQILSMIRKGMLNEPRK